MLRSPPNLTKSRFVCWSAARDPASHGAMDSGAQESNLGVSVKWPERRVQKPGAKTRLPDGADWRTLGFVPGDIQPVVRHRPRDLQQPARGRKRAVFPGIGGEFVKYQRKTDGQFGRKKQRIAVQVESNMPVGSEFRQQEILDVAPAAIDARDEIVGCR